MIDDFVSCLFNSSQDLMMVKPSLMQFVATFDKAVVRYVRYKLCNNVTLYETSSVRHFERATPSICVTK